MRRCAECNAYIGHRPARAIYCSACEGAFADDTLAGELARARRQEAIDLLDRSIVTWRGHLDRERAQ